MTSYGQIAYRLTKLLPGLDPDVLDGLIIDRYKAILDAIKWQRRLVVTTLQTVAGERAIALPADCRIFHRAEGPGGDLHLSDDPLLFDTWRPESSSSPHSCRLYMDSETGRMQLELFPAPDAVFNITVEYTAEDVVFGVGETPAETSLLPWVREGALVEGVYSRGLAIKAVLEPEKASMYINLSQIAAASAATYLSDMRRTAASNKGATKLRARPWMDAGYFRRY